MLRYPPAKCHAKMMSWDLVTCLNSLTPSHVPAREPSMVAAINEVKRVQDEVRVPITVQSTYFHVRS